jgi:hypothetical protein
MQRVRSRLGAWSGLAVGVVLGGAIGAWAGPREVVAQGPMRVQRWSYACERVPIREVVVGAPVFSNDDVLSRALARRDEQGWELVTASQAGAGITLLCFRQPQ